MGSIVIAVLAAIIPAVVGAAEARPDPIHVVEVAIPDRAGLDALTEQGFDIGTLRGNVATIYATSAELDQLKSMGYQVVEVGRQPEPPPERRGTASKGLGIYHNYDTLTADLQAYAAAHPAICRMTSLGLSVQGRQLWAMLITDNPDMEEDEPEFKYVGAMHGDESLGAEMCMYFIVRLLQEYGASQRISDLVNTTAIWVLPVMNPDGLELGTRLNASGYDLNRSFPAYPDDFTGTIFDSPPLDTSGRPPEVARVMEWTGENSFVLSANFHTGALVVNYPYDDDGKGTGVEAPTPDDALFQAISRRYSMHNPPMWNNPEFEDGIVNGSAWYVVLGGMQDWNYRYVGCNEVTIEMSNVKRPAPALIPGFWEDNAESMLGYAESVHIGVRGLVSDASTGQPIWAEVRVDGNPHPVFTDKDVGDYHRMLLPGTYNLLFAAPDYVPRLVSGISVHDGQATRADMALWPVAVMDVNSDGAINAVDVQLVINAALGLEVPSGCNCDIDGGGVTATDVQLIINAALMV